MAPTALKPRKIQINNGTASGMYILLSDEEIKYTKDNETKPPNRIYQIQVAVETMFKNKRCRGKRTFNIPKGTSIIKAVADMQKYKTDMQFTLREKGTLKLDTIKLSNIDTKNRKFSLLYEAWLNTKKINQRANTIKAYDSCYRTHLNILKNKIIDDITVDDIQNIINNMINNGLKPATVAIVKMIMKPLLDINDVILNWKKITLPKNTTDRTFKGTDEDAVKIVDALREYPHIIAKGVFAFLLSGRRINETLQLRHENINYKTNTFTIPKEYAKTNQDFTFALTSELIQAIKSQKTTKGKIFLMGRDSAIYNFKKALKTIGIHNMVMHDLRSMIAVTALRNGADIYDVSKMLSHKSLATTEARYLTGGTERASNAQTIFANKFLPNKENIIDVEVIEDEFTALKNIYPNATDEKIHKIIEMMK
ncbi:MAG: tyrosine-type recombinase/integrase [Campylobacterales bacterium]|nr:tyrosine-type recombinase/integrase [Campylobacterales bacterium]